jgi:hypothetical protein
LLPRLGNEEHEPFRVLVTACNNDRRASVRQE